MDKGCYVFIRDTYIFVKGHSTRSASTLEQGYPWQVFRKFLGKADGLMSPLGKNSEAFSIY